MCKTYSCLTEYDEEEVMTVIRNESFEKGINIGRKEGRMQGNTQMLCILVRDGILEPEKAANKLGITIKEFETLMRDTEIE